MTSNHRIPEEVVQFYTEKLWKEINQMTSNQPVTKTWRIVRYCPTPPKKEEEK